MLLNITTNTEDQKRSEATLYLRDKASDKMRLTLLLCAVFTAEQATENFDYLEEGLAEISLVFVKI